MGVIAKKPLLSLLRRARDTPRLNLKLPRVEEMLWEHTDIERPLISEVPVPFRMQNQPKDGSKNGANL